MGSIDDRIKIVKEEIVDIKVDAIVNPTDEYFSGSAGLDKLIQKSAVKNLVRNYLKVEPAKLVIVLLQRDII